MDAKLRILEIVDAGFGPVLRGDFILTVRLEDMGKTWEGSYTTEGCDPGFAQTVGSSFAIAIPKGDSIENVAKAFSSLGERMTQWSRSHLTPPHP